MVGHAGTRLLADLADATGLTGRFGDALGSVRQRRGRHDPGRVAVDLAVMLADGGEAIADLAVLRNQPELFGPVASDATAWRVLADVDAAALARLRSARAAAREVAWAQRTETSGDLPVSTAAGRPIPGFVLDLDASIVVCHSEKESQYSKREHHAEDAAIGASRAEQSLALLRTFSSRKKGCSWRRRSNVS